MSNNDKLIDAIYKSDIETVKSLLDDPSIDVNTKDTNGNSALYFAVTEGDIEIVQALLNHKDIDVNASNNDGWTALYSAVSGGDIEKVHALLNHQAIDVNVQVEKTGNSALMKAVKNRRLDIVKALLNFKPKEKDKPAIDVNAKNIGQFSAVVLAVMYDDMEIVRALRASSRLNLTHEDLININNIVTRKRSPDKKYNITVESIQLEIPEIIKIVSAIDPVTKGGRTYKRTKKSKKSRKARTKRMKGNP